MSISKCPICHSTDINSVTCNNCGAMLLFEGEENKSSDRGTSYNRKPAQSMEDIIKEILEASNVKSSPFEKIEYIDDNRESFRNEDNTSEQDSQSAQIVDPNKSFVDIALEMGYADKEEEKPEDVSDNCQASVDEGETVKEETVIFDVKPVEVSPFVESEEQTEEKTSENADDIVDMQIDSEEEKKIVTSESVDDSKLAELSVDGENIPASENENEDTDSSDGEEITEDKVSLVEKISQKVNEKIKMESASEDSDEEVDLFAPPEWTHSEKTVVKETQKKAEKEGNGSYTGFIDMTIDTGFNKILNICRFLLMISMLVTVVCMFLPSTRIGGFSSGQSVQIFAIVSVIPFVVGFVLSIAEKHYIRKFVYSLLASVCFLAVYFIFTLSIAGSSSKDVVYPVLCLVIIAVSVVGIFVDKSSKARKENTWFDAFAYILLFVNLFMIMFIAMFVILVPDMIGGTEISRYLCEFGAVLVVGAISSVLMIKRVRFGSDLLIISAIALIVVNIVSYNKIMSAVSFDYTVNIPYMHYMGYVVSGVNIICTLFPAGMFFWMKHIKKITPEIKSED